MNSYTVHDESVLLLGQEEEEAEHGAACLIQHRESTH